MISLVPILFHRILSNLQTEQVYQAQKVSRTFWRLHTETAAKPKAALSPAWVPPALGS